MSGLSGDLALNITNSEDEPMTKSIPLSVLNLLANRRHHTPGRLPRYIHRPEDRTPRNGLRYAEVRDLVADGVIHNNWIGPGAAIAVLDHEQAAICEFCSEVYAAWDRFRLGPNWREPPERPLTGTPIALS
jgi:hypothetical protein